MRESVAGVHAAGSRALPHWVSFAAGMPEPARRVRVIRQAGRAEPDFVSVNSQVGVAVVSGHSLVRFAPSHRLVTMEASNCL